MNENFYMYKGYPLVRKGNELYFGFMQDPFVMWLTITEKNDDGSAKKVKVIQMDTKASDPLKAFVKSAEKECGLYEALDLAAVWLEKALKN